jgi:hypothetical protein
LGTAAAALVIESSSTPEKVGERIEMIVFPFIFSCPLTMLGGEKEVYCSHAKIDYDAEKNMYMITDLHSTNGATMDEKKLLPGVPHVISSGCG